MANLATNQFGSHPYCGGVLSRLAYRYAKHKGLDADKMLKSAGLTVQAVKNQYATIGIPNQIKFVHLVADALGDDLLGFHLGTAFDIRELGLLYYVAASAETLGDALKRLERYVGIQNEAVKISVRKARAVSVVFSYAGISRYQDTHQMGSFIAALIRICRHVAGRSLHPIRVRIIQRISADRLRLERLLGGKIEDNSPVDEVEFPGASWNSPLVSADPYLQRMCLRCCEAALARRNKSLITLRTKVENEIAVQLPHRKVRHHVVAAKLGMSPRTLARRLSAEGLSFADIVVEVRSALATRYLADRSLTISQIAWLLGYAQVGTFTRAFRRWTGMAPTAARARQQRRSTSPVD